MSSPAQIQIAFSGRRSIVNTTEENGRWRRAVIIKNTNLHSALNIKTIQVDLTPPIPTHEEMLSAGKIRKSEAHTY